MTARVCRITVGGKGCDIEGFTNTVLQAAVDRVASLGGGEVVLSKGVFRMADALHLRSRVKVRGQGADTVLKKNAMKSARIVSFLGYGHDDLEVDRPEAFAVGDGVTLRDRNAFGFYTTVATLVRREGAVWFTNRPHNHDYLGSQGGVVETLFPVIEAVDIEDAVVEKLCVDGNLRHNPVQMNGCRGGGFLALRCRRLLVRGLVVRNYNGDGLGFQTCDDMRVADCLVEGCTGNGYHPGSGSNRFHMTGCTARKNGGCGLFYCLRVRHGLLEDSVFEHNGGHGVSIGERDTDNMNRRLVIRRNGGHGIYFRPCERANAAHRTVFEGCRVGGNGRRMKTRGAEIVLQGETSGIRLAENEIRWHLPNVAILVKREVLDCEMANNRIEPQEAGAVSDRRSRARRPVTTKGQKTTWQNPSSSHRSSVRSPKS